MEEQSLSKPNKGALGLHGSELSVPTVPPPHTHRGQSVFSGEQVSPAVQPLIL